MAHENEGSAIRSSGIHAVEASGLDGLSGDCLGDSLLVGVDDGGIAAHLAQQRLGDSDRLELVAVAVHQLHHLVVLRAVHQVGGLDDQILHAVVTAKVIGVSLFTLDQLLLGVGQGVPCGLGGLALGVSVLVALLHIDGVDEICHVLCCHFIGLLAAHLAGGSRACCGAAGGSRRRCTAAGEHTGTQGQCGGSGGDALPVLVGCFTHCFESFLFGWDRYFR